MQTHSLLTSALLTLATASAFAGETPAAPKTKSGFHLFNPTPRELMREMSTDRPDQTESAYTVDAGHFQLEMDFIKYTYDHHSTDGVKSETWNIAPMNLKVGLLNNVDLQIVLDNYVEERTKADGITDRVSGFGDITTRLKVNVWGNDGGATALAIMPYVKFPLNESDLRNGKTEGGVIIPLAVELPGGWGMGLMTEVDFVHNDEGDYDTEWVNSITFAHDIVGNLGGYVEFFSVVSTAPGYDWQGQFDVGLTYAVTDDIQLDAGCNFGVTRSAPDFQPFVGLSVRF